MAVARQEEGHSWAGCCRLGSQPRMAPSQQCARDGGGHMPGGATSPCKGHRAAPHSLAEPSFHPQLQDAGVRSDQSHLPALSRMGTTVGWILSRAAPGNTRAPRPTPCCCWLRFPIWIWLGTEPLAPSTGAGRCQHMEAITGAGSRCEEGPEQHSPSRGLCSGLCPRCGTGEMPQPPACSLCWHSARAEQGRGALAARCKGVLPGQRQRYPIYWDHRKVWGSLLPSDGWWRGLSDAQHPWEPVPMVPLEVAWRSGAGLARCPVPTCSAWLVALSPRCLQPAPGGHGQPKAPGSTASILRVHPAPKGCWGAVSEAVQRGALGADSGVTAPTW